MKRILSLVLSAALCLFMLPPASGEGRPVLTIGDRIDRSGNRFDDRLGMWQYLEDLVGMDIQYVYLTPEEYAAGLSSGDLPDIVYTENNLSTILESGAALDVDPYLEEYCPNFLRGDTRLSYDVLKQLGDESGGFYFFPARIGYNGVGYGNVASQRGYVVRWDYYRELGYPPINSEDDYLDVLLQMRKNHPFTEEGYPTYLYGTDNFSGYDTAFRAELSLDYWVSYKYQNNIFTNEIYDGYTDPAHSKWWSSMEWENKLYRAGKADGSYDLDLFTQTLEQFNAKVTRGQYLGLHAAKDQLYNEMVRKDPDTLAGYSMVPTAATNFYTNVYQLLGGCDPAEALARVNVQLCERNSTMMFVTVWLAVLEISTGKIVACNAGHEHPGLRRADGRFELIRYKHGRFVGTFRKAVYENRELELRPGDRVFVYTDGVPEAKDGSGEMFGEERLEAALNACPDGSPEEILQNVKSAVDAFVGDAEQYDDLTMMCLEYRGPAPAGSE